MGAVCADLRSRKASLRLALVSASALIAPAALAQGVTPTDKLQFTHNVIGLSVFAAGILISATAALLYLSSRGKRAVRERQIAAELSAARAALDRASAFLAVEQQIMVAWGAASDEPDISGDVSLVLEAAPARSVLAFGAWLAPDLASKLEACVERLRQRGESFRLPLLTISGRHVEADGRAIAGRAVEAPGIASSKARNESVSISARV